MSTIEHTAPVAISKQYADWLNRERRTRLMVRAAQLALLIVFLIFWEVLPREQIVNPLFTSYPSALWPTFLDLLKTTLGMYGHCVTDERHGVTEDGMRYFGLISLKSPSPCPRRTSAPRRRSPHP